MSDKINEVSQQLSTDELVELFILDLSPIGTDQVLYFSNSKNPDGTDIVFGGNTYYAVDFESEGWAYDGQGAFPRPTLTVSNVFDFLSNILYETKDLVGAKITRIRTYSRFLDGQPDADPGAMFAPDIYVVFRKRRHNKAVIEFELSAAADQETVNVPGRQILRDTCTHTYRRYVPGVGFDYSQATCPYSGTSYFNEKGEATTITSDNCGLQLRDCKLRFGNKNLPTRAFPGVVRARV